MAGIIFWKTISFFTILSFFLFFITLPVWTETILETSVLLSTPTPFLNQNATEVEEEDDFRAQVEEERRSELAKIIGCATFTALSITGITGNSLVIYAIMTDPTVKTKKQISNLAILNLAYTDLMTTSLSTIPAAVTILFDEYPFGPVFCRVWSVLNIIGLVATMGLLMVISGERFIAVGWPLHYPQWVTYNRLLGACLYIWLSTVICIFFWAWFECAYDFWAGICDFTWQLFGPGVPTAFWYGIYCTIWFFIVPTIAILFCNVGIIRMSKEKGRVGKLESPPKKIFEVRGAAAAVTKIHDNLTKVNIKILKAMVIVTVSYFVLTFPVALIRVVKLLSGPNGPARHIPGWLTLVCTFLQFSASIVNPLIYGLFRKDFRDSYARVFKKIIRK